MNCLPTYKGRRYKSIKELKNSINLNDNLREEIITSLLADNSFTVEINTSKKQPDRDNTTDGFVLNNKYYSRGYANNGEQLFQVADILDSQNFQMWEPDTFTEPQEITKEEYLKAREQTSENTQHYSNLTVPGGTNYTENEIATPDIMPSIEGHAQFSTDKGIGWFRSDDVGILDTKEETSFFKIGDKEVGTSKTRKLLPSKTRRILEVQSDLFQKSRGKNNLLKVPELRKNGDKFTANDGEVYERIDFQIEGFYSDGISKGVFTIKRLSDNKITKIDERRFKERFGEKVKTSSKNQFLQLLNQKNNWVTFFVKSIIQDSAKKGYEKVLFPKGDTAAKIEGHQSLEEFKRQKEARIKELENNKKFAVNGFIEDIDYDDMGRPEMSKIPIEQIDREINIHKQELADVESGQTQLSSIANFYETTVTNILKKNGYNPVEITDEYGNKWNEIQITPKVLSEILLQKNEADQIIGQANIKAGKVLIDAINQKQDTLPHEYAHHYIAWFRDTPIVQEAIKKWGSEEALVQSIGEQVVKQKGEAYNWWNKFVKWIFKQFNKLSTLKKEELTKILTDAFLTREDLSKIKQPTQQSGEVKEGVSEVFKENPELSEIGTEEQYSKYLDSVFPDSKVKDIVYHGTTIPKSKILEEGMKNNMELFTPEDQDYYEVGELGPGYYFTDDLNYVKKYGEVKIEAILNSPRVEKTSFTDGIQQFHVPLKDQIHILGSKKDIQGFKEFVSKPTQQTSEQQESKEEFPRTGTLLGGDSNNPNPKFKIELEDGEYVYYYKKGNQWLEYKNLKAGMDRARKLFPNKYQQLLDENQKRFMSEAVDLESPPLRPSIKGIPDKTLANLPLSNYKELMDKGSTTYQGQTLTNPEFRDLSSPPRKESIPGIPDNVLQGLSEMDYFIFDKMGKITVFDKSSNKAVTYYNKSKQASTKTTVSKPNVEGKGKKLFKRATRKKQIDDDNVKFKTTFTGDKKINPKLARKRLIKLLGKSVPVSVVDTLIEIGNKQAYGMASKAGITLSKLASEGTEYHEAFHIVFTNIIGDRRKEIFDSIDVTLAEVNSIRDWATKYGVDPIEAAKEEKLADMFEDYMMGQQTILGWLFQKIKDFIDFISGNTIPAHKLFRDIEQGKFRGKLKYFPDSKLRDTNYSPYEEKQAINIVLSLLDNAVTKAANKTKVIKNLEEGYSSIFTGGYLLDYDIEDSVIDQLITRFDNAETQEQRDALGNLITQLRGDFSYEDGQLYTFDGPMYGTLYQKILNSLHSRGLRFGDSEINKDAVVDSLMKKYAGKSVSVKEGLSSRLKVILNNINVTVNGNPRKDSLGLGITLKYSGNEAYSIIQSEIGNSIDYNDMISKLENSKIELVKELYRVRKDNELILKDLWNIAQKIHPTYYTLLHSVDRKKTETLDGKKVTINNNRMQIFETNREKKKNLIRSDIYSVIGNEKNIENLSDPVDYLLQFLPQSVVSNITNHEEFVAEFKKNLEKPEFNIDGFVKKIEPYYPNSYQSAHLNVEGERVYEWMNANFIGRALNGYMNKDFYSQDVMYKNLPIFDDKLEFIYLDGIKYNGQKSGVKYTRYSNSDMLETLLAFGISISSTQMIVPLPILETAPTLGAVKMKKYTIKEAKEHIINMAKAEYLRTVQEQPDIKSYSERAKDMILFGDILEVDENGKIDYSATERNLNKKVRTQLKNLKTDIIKYNVKMDYKDDALISYLYNHILNHSQLMLVSVGDPAFYKSSVDYYKRAKEIHSPGTYLNKKGEWKLKIVSDIEIRSPQADQIALVLGGIKNDSSKTKQNNIVLKSVYQKKGVEYAKSIGGIFSMRVDSFKNHFGNPFTGTGKKGKGVVKEFSTVKEAVQAYEDWLLTDKYDKEFPELKERKKWILSQIKSGNLKNKPIVYYKELGELSHANILDKLINNYSEYYNSSLTDAQTYIDPIGYKERIDGLNRWTEKHEEQFKKVMNGDIGYDVNWEVLKPFYFAHHQEQIGKEVKIIPFQKKDSEFTLFPVYGIKMVKGKKNPLYSPVYQELLEGMGYEFTDSTVKYNPKARRYDAFTFDTTIKVGRPNYGEGENIVSMNWEDWRLQQETPQHYFDEHGNFGTQIMKLITADLKTLSPLMDKYSKLINEDTKVDFENAKKDFKETKKLLENEILERGLGEEYLKALESLPLYHPIHTQRIQSILNSFFRKRVAKKDFVHGFSFINTSSWGHNLKIVWNDPNDPKKGVKYLEALAPPYNKAFNKFKDRSGQIDIDKIKGTPEEKMLQGLVYRIPTEDKFSMIPIKIVGFLPSGSGNIMLPHEATTMVGLDFDIDKVFGMYYGLEPTFDEYVDSQKTTLDDKQRALELGYDQMVDNPEIVNLIIREVKKERITAESYNEYISRVKRDNQKLDIMLEILNHPETVNSLLTPQGFDEIKKVNRKYGLEDKSKLDLTDYSTLITISNRMNAGQGILGVYADANAANSILQYAVNKLRLKGDVYFNDDSFNTLGRTDLQERITKALGMRIGMAADNGKDPQAEYYNANLYTAPVEVMLIMLGVPSETVQLFLAQPIIRQFAQDYFNNGASAQTERDLIAMYGIENTVPTGFKTEELGNNILSFNKMSESQKQSYISSSDQKAVLETFLAYSKQAKELNDLISALKVGDKGAGTNQIANYNKIKLFNQNYDNIEGVREFLNSDMFMFDLYREGIKNANDIIDEQLIPLGHGFKSVVASLEKYKGYNLTEKEMQDVLNNMYTYVFQKIFPVSKQEIINTTRKLPELKRKYPNNILIQRMYVQDNIIKFMGAIGNDYAEVDEIKRSWDELEYKEVEMLMKYSFAQSGLSQTFKGFGHMQSVQYHIDLFSPAKYGNQIDSELKSILTSRNDQFLDQYIRNVYKYSAIIRNVSTLDGKVDGNILTIENNSNSYSTSDGPLKYLKHKGVLYEYKSFSKPKVYERVEALGKNNPNGKDFFEYREKSEYIENKVINKKGTKFNNLRKSPEEYMESGEIQKICK